MRNINLSINGKNVVVSELDGGFFEILIRDPSLRRLECKFVKRNNEWGIIGENPFTETEVAVIGAETDKMLK